MRKISIGRVNSNEFIVDHESVSRQHAELYINGDLYELVDLKSTNGTFLLEDGEKHRLTKFSLDFSTQFFFGDAGPYSISDIIDAGEKTTVFTR